MAKPIKKHHLLFILFTWIPISIFAQVDPSLENLRNVIPPSPNASNLGRYAEWPVSLYTGVPNISIPIYELKGRSLKLPIDISYHAAGNRVGDIASWVGLGWSLNAGGIISRSVRGLPDEDSYFEYAGTYSDPNNFASSSNVEGSSQKHQVAAANQDGDSQQDMYTLSAMGKSYRLLLKADGSVTTMPYSNVKVTYNRSSSWTVTLEDGTSLLFGGTGFVETNNNARYGANTGGIPYISSWYLQTITSPVGEKINFTYTSSTIIQDTHFTESDWTQYRTSTSVTSPNTVSACPLVTNSPAPSINAEKQSITSLNLAKIESDLTRIDLLTVPGTRTDLNGGTALSEIKIFSKLANKYIDDYQFNYVYSQAVSGSEYSSNIQPADLAYYHNRLKLTGLKRLAPDNSAYQQWTFQYNSQNLPSRRSFAQDHSGYFNGATTNTTLLPQVYFALPIFPGITTGFQHDSGFIPGNNHPLGGIRDFNEAYMQAEILTQITYPTGGYTKFNYEANRIPVATEQFIPDVVSQHLYLTANQTPFANSITNTFTITKPQYVHLTLTSSISQTILNDLPGAKCFANILNSSGELVALVTGSDNNYYNLLTAGTYSITISTNAGSGEFNTANDNINIVSTLDYSKSAGTQNINQLVGGLRVKSILNYDGISTTPLNDRYFNYASEFVINPIDPQNDYLTTQNVYTSQGGTGESCYFTKVTRNTSTKYSLGSIQGGAIGYENVTTLYGITGGNGKTISLFSNGDIYSSQTKVFPYPPADQREWRRGLLLDQTDFNISLKKVRHLTNTYSFASKGSVGNFVAGYSTIADVTTCIELYHYCGIATLPYSISSEQVLHNSSTETTYNINGTDSVTNSSNYYYDNALNTQPVRVVNINSKGESVTSYNRTALELTDINASIPLSAAAITAINTMVSRNMVGTSIESEKSVKGKVTSKLLVNYQLNNSNVVPQEVKSQAGTNPLQSRILFNNYDAYGNLLEQQKTGGPVNDYIYDYLSSYPIASVINGSQANIAYTSFESSGSGNWTIASAVRDSDMVTKFLTGHRSYNLSNGAVSKAGLTSTVTYIVSYWTRNAAALTIAGTVTGYPIKGATINGWTYYEHHLTGQSSVSVSGTGNIDELRLYPVNAQMTTYTYIPLIGISSTCDAKNEVSYYEYDGLLRLLNIKDKDGNIVKNYAYNYINPTPGSGSTTTYYSAIKSGSFTSSSCTTGHRPVAVIYTIPAGAYTSISSQADADLQAANALSNGGPAYATANGCPLVYSSTVKSGSFTPASCTAGHRPVAVTYTIAAGAYTSISSQADADLQATNALNTDGPAYATTNGCPLIFNSVVKSASFTPTCSTGYQPTAVTYTIAAATYTSIVSQADADLQATNALNANGPNYAANNGGCLLIYRNAVKSGSYIKNDCPLGPTTGTAIIYTVAANKYTSTASQADADQQAQNDIIANGQKNANTLGSCIASISGTASGYRGQTYTFYAQNALPGDTFVWTLPAVAGTVTQFSGGGANVTLNAMTSTAPYSYTLNVTITSTNGTVRYASMACQSIFCSTCPIN